MRLFQFGTCIKSLGMVLAFALLAWPGMAQQQQVHRNGFENDRTCWVRSNSDVAYEELAHAITSDKAHDGQKSEHIQILAKPGGTPSSYIYYQYGIGKGVISDEFSARIWVNATRPGIQLSARVILPNEKDPNNLENCLATVLRGESYRTTGRWQQLEIPRPVRLVREVQSRMQTQLGRPVDFRGAYVDALMLNVYSGPGPADVWIDDLEVGPVVGKVPLVRTSGRGGSRLTRQSIVEFKDNNLLVGGKRTFFRAITLTDTPLRVLRDAGFNTVFLPADAAAGTVQDAGDMSFWLVPQLKLRDADGKPTPSDEIGRTVTRLADNDGVLFYHLGADLNLSDLAASERAAQLIQGMDVGRPTGADVDDSLAAFSRHVKLPGAHRFPLMTSMELTGYRDWLREKHLAARESASGSFLWTTIQTHVPDRYLQLVYDRTGAEGFSDPVGPLPEQVRLLAYTAIGSGCKGLAFSSDRWLADSHQGRDRLLGCALLNMELDMLEPLLVHMDDAPQWIDTSVPEVKAAVLRWSEKATLVLPIWMGKGSQYVPGQAAVSKLSMIVPQIPQTMQAWQVCPAEVRNVRIERAVGGSKITLPEFNLTSAIVFTADSRIVLRLQDQARARRQQAAQWSFDLAVYELEKIKKTNSQLITQGHALHEAGQLLAEAENRLRSAEQQWKTRAFAESYHESQRSMRPVRILMRAQWEQAVRQLDTPTASPYALSYFTLPRHWQFMDQRGGMIPTTNILPGGDFEIIPQRVQAAWKAEERNPNNLVLYAARVTDVQRGPGKDAVEPPHEGNQCAMLQIKPRPRTTPPAALDRTRLSLTSPTVRVQPGVIVQISGWVRIVSRIHGSADGAMLYDSVGGEELAVRLTEPTQWKRVTLYRRVPSSGTVNVTVALSGLGTAYFDDIRVEPLIPGSGTVTPATRVDDGSR